MDFEEQEPSKRPPQDGGIASGRRRRSPKSYEVVFEDFDTRIREYGDDRHEYPTFDDAKEAALDYLAELIEDCQRTFEEIKWASSFEEYSQEKPERGK